MIKQFARCVREYKKDIILATIFMIFAVAMEVIIPSLMAEIIDYGISVGNMDYVVRNGSLIAIFALLALFFGAMAGRFYATSSAGFAKNVRKDMYYHIQGFSFANIDKFSTSSLVTRLTTDVSNIQNAFQMIVRSAIRSPLMLIFSLIMTFSINAQLAMVFIVVLPILAIGIYSIVSNAFPIYKKVLETYDKLNNVVQENLKGIRVVKSYVREDYEVEKFKKVSEQIYGDFTKAEKLFAFMSPLMQASGYISILLISWFGAQMVVAGTLTIGQLVSFIIYSSQILMALMVLSMMLITTTVSRAAAERILEVLLEKSDLNNPENPIFEVESGSISFKNVDFGYIDDSNKFCLRDINFEISEGETIGIIGSTGSSKTSLVQLISRLYDVKNGQICVGGVDVRDYDLKVLRDNVVMILQKNVLFSGTIKENLRWGNENASDEELERVCKLACAHDFIDGFSDKYDTHIEQGGSNVSGGQKQRLCIARALLKKPKILILDDSTSAVDTKTEASIKKALKSELPSTTKIIIAQRISSIDDADRIIVMDSERINGMGTHSELLKSNKIYQEIYNSQLKEGGTL